ncbi:MAG: DJ-1/PfpI family protein, partial [Elusimicrobiota bacterium]|nr:DJ-1/PfpI family protein [Elusimicrobiota bacterium]
KNKVVAAICHGGWVLASAGIVRDRKVTGFHAIKDDLVNAGGKFIDKEVVVDGNLITSRNPYDLPAFCREILRKLEKK